MERTGLLCRYHIAEIADLRERAEAVFNLVMSKVNWNGKYEMSPVPTSETLKNQSGSNADINLLLIQSFNEVGLTAAPVVLRTRDQGLLPYNFPAIRKLSTFIVAVVMPAGANVYLDASSKNGYLNVQECMGKPAEDIEVAEEYHHQCSTCC